MKITKHEIKELLQEYINTHPFWSALEKGNEEEVKQHIANGQDINEVLEVFKYFSGAWGHLITPLFIAFKSGNRKMVNLLLQFPKLDISDDLFAIAIKYGYSEVISHCLEKSKEYVNKVFPVRYKVATQVDSYVDAKARALHWAVYHGHLDIIKLLCEAGADVNVMYAGDGAPLHYATAHGHDNAEIVDYLLKKGANLNQHNGMQTPMTPFQMAIMYKRPNIATVLAESGADITRPIGDNLRAMCYAIELNALRLVQVIYERDKQQRTVKSWGKDPIELAQHFRRSEILLYLISKKYGVDEEQLVCVEIPCGRNRTEICVEYKKNCVSVGPPNEKNIVEQLPPVTPPYLKPQIESNTNNMLTATPGTLFSKPQVIAETDQHESVVVKTKKEKREEKIPHKRKEIWKVKTTNSQPIVKFTKETYGWFGNTIISDKINCLRNFKNVYYLSPERFLKNANSAHIDTIDQLLSVDSNFDRYQGIKSISLHPPVYVDLVIGDENDPNARIFKKLKVQYEVKKQGIPSRIACVKIPADKLNNEADGNGHPCLILGVKFLKKGFHDGYRCNKTLKIVIPSEFLTEYGLSGAEHVEENKPNRYVGRRR